MDEREKRAAVRALGVFAALLFALSLAGCRSQDVKTSSEPVGWTEPAPFTLPAEQLVVPYELIPKAPDDPAGIRAAIAEAFGPLLESVSVEATAFAGITDDGGSENTGFRIEYHLVGCSTPAIMFVTDLDDCGFVPPCTQMYDTPPGRDWMSPERFRVLLRAWGKASAKPFGGLTGYASGIAPYGVAPLQSAAVLAPNGTRHRVGDLWVITEGASSQSEFKRQQYDSYEVPGYVFVFPEGGTPEYLGRANDLGWQEGLGD